MKLCPACSRLYDDDKLRFCLDDGSNLLDKNAGTPAPPTLTLPSSPANVPTMKQSFEPARPFDAPAVTKRRSLLPWVLGAVALLVLGSAMVLGVFLLRPKSALPWHLKLAIDQTAPDAEVMRQTVAVLEKRLDAYGLRNFQVLPQADGGIVLNLPAIDDPERLKHLIGQGGKLELVHVISPPSPQIVQTFPTREEAVASLPGGTGLSTDRRVLPYLDRDLVSDPRPTKWVVVEAPSIIKGSDLRDARATSRSGGGDYQVGFSLNKAGAEKFGAWTAANINNYLGIVLDGEVKSIAYIKSQIFDSGEISGRFTKQSAEDLALVLRIGALPAPVKFVSETTDKPQ